MAIDPLTGVIMLLDRWVGNQKVVISICGYFRILITSNCFFCYFTHKFTISPSVSSKFGLITSDGFFCYFTHKFTISPSVSLWNQNNNNNVPPNCNFFRNTTTVPLDLLCLSTDLKEGRCCQDIMLLKIVIPNVALWF